MKEEEIVNRHHMFKRPISLKEQGFPGEASMIQSNISRVPSARNHFLFSSLGMNPEAIFVAALQRNSRFAAKTSILFKRSSRNLSKELPRILCVKKAADFWVFSKAGRDLAELHINYEKVEPYPVTVVGPSRAQQAAPLRESHTRESSVLAEPRLCPDTKGAHGGALLRGSIHTGPTDLPRGENERKRKECAIMSEPEESKLAVFEGKQIRKTLYDGTWWFVVEDVVLALIESRDPKQYIQRMKQRDPELGKGWVQIVRTLSIPTEGGAQKLNCANAEGIFRLIQSIPSPKAEPFKRWLARVGKERLDEIENPELSMARMQELYEKKGYPKEWIDKRLRGIAVRQDLTDEWKNRGAKTTLEYAILTNEIMQGAFGLKVEEYKQVKALERENLRDHMTDIELILTMLAEATTTKLHRDRDSRGMVPLKNDAKDGGAVAGRTRKDIETQTDKPVISAENFKQLSAGKQKKLKAKKD
jgi:prophage antirepressor-like protein